MLSICRMISILVFLFLVPFIFSESHFLSCYSVPNNPPVSTFDPFLCTHLLVIGPCLISANGTIILPSRETIQPYKDIKKKNPDLKVLITLLPTMNQVMSRIVLDDVLMDKLADDTIAYLNEHNLDGFDIDWEFPVWSSDAKKTDKKGFSNLLQKLRQKFNQQEKKLLLTLAVSAPYDITKKGYDVPTINRVVDYVQIMNYDFHDFKKLEPVVGFNAPLKAAWYEWGIVGKMNSDYSTRYWLKLGMNRTKLIFGIPTYGRGYNLLSKHMHFPYSPATGPSVLGDDVGYSDVCNLTQSSAFRYKWSKAAASPYLYHEHQWLSIEDARSVTEKTAYAKNMRLGGVMVFALHGDDPDGVCHGETFPLIRAVKKELTRQNSRRE